ARALERETPQRNANWGARVIALRDELSGEYRRALLILAGAVAFVLLIACANVANLLLARGAARQREIAIRAALGAGRGRVVRQLLTETAVLTALGGSAGLLVAFWGLDLLLAMSPLDLTNAGPVRLSYPALGFTAVVSVVTTVICGLAPAFEGSRTDIQDTMRDSPRQAAGAVSYLPLTGLGAGTGFTIEGQPPPPPGQDYVTDVSVCDNGYLRTLKVPLLSGRLFTEREMREKSNVVIVSQALVRTYFPHENPIGKRLSIVMTDPVVPTEIIGVIGDVKF